MRISTTTGELMRRGGSEAAALDLLAEAGFEACDFSMFAYAWNGDLWAAEDAAFDQHFHALRNHARDCGVAVGQAHAPFPTTTADPEEAAYRLRIIRRAIRAAALLDCPALVIHPALHHIGTPASREEIKRYNLEMYESLVPDLKAQGVQCALENMFATDAQGRPIPCYFSTAEDIMEAMNALGNRHFCVCLDIGHMQLVQQPPADTIRTLGPALKALHVHDNNGLTDQHVIPYAGITDWDAVCGALRDNSYSGTLSLESDTLLAAAPEDMTKGMLRLMAMVARSLADKIEAD